MRLLLLTAVAALSGAAAMPASAGELVGGAWRSLECAKPPAPEMNRADAQGLNESINRYNAYVGEVSRYNGCLKDEAARDMQAIADGHAATQDEVMREAEAVRPRGTQAQ